MPGVVRQSWADSGDVMIQDQALSAPRIARGSATVAVADAPMAANGAAAAVNGKAGGTLDAARALPRPGLGADVSAEAVRRVALAVVVGLLTIAWWLPAPVWSTPTWRTGLLLVGAVSAWALAVLPDFVVALGLLTLYNMTHVGAAKVSLSGFASPSWFLLVATLGLGAALSKSGLIERVALRLLLLFPPRFLGQSLALVFGGLLVTPVFPLTIARCALAGPLTSSLASALGYRPGTREAVGLGLASFVGSALVSRAFLSGATLNFVAWGLLPHEAQVSWALWAVAAAPATLIVIVGALVIIRLVFRPKVDETVARDAIAGRLAAMGPLTSAQRAAGAVTLAVLGGFIAAPHVGVETAWIAAAGAVGLAAIGVLTREHLRSAIDWPLLLFLGVVLSLPAMLAHVGLDAHVASVLTRVAASVEAGPAVAIAALLGMTVAARFVLSEWVGVPLLTVAFLPAAATLGLHPWIIAFVVLVGANLWLLPYQFTPYLAFLSGADGRLFAHRQVWGFSLAYLGLVSLGLLASIPLWRHLGLLD